MKTFINDMKVLKYYKEEEIKSIILMSIGFAIVSLITKLVQDYTELTPLLEPQHFLLFAGIGFLISITMCTAKYIVLDRKILREFDEEFDAELKWKRVLHDFNKKSEL